MRLFVIAAPIIALLAACTPPAEPVSGPVLITVFHGDGEMTPEPLGLYNTWSLAGPATALTAADLAALPQSVIETGYPLGADASRWSGPRLSLLLHEIGAPGAGARLTAVDGYQVEVTAEDLAAHEPILALRRDGEPLAIGGLGPAILIWPRDTDAALADLSDNQWPWAVFAVEGLERSDG
ncbi:hypothetical protein ACWCOP_11670 [Maricaulaceae bacterium MS644]